MKSINKHPRLLIPLGLLAGLLLGIIARAWMRWVSTDPEFSWGGSLGVVIIFGIFGMIQAIVFSYTQKPHQRSRKRVVRAIGVFFSLPLFMAAGAVMFPTVLTASLALWRAKWKKWIRVFLATVSATFTVLVAKSEIVDDFGWSIATIGRLLLFGAIYSLIIRALRSTVTATN